MVDISVVSKDVARLTNLIGKGDMNMKLHMAYLLMRRKMHPRIKWLICLHIKPGDYIDYRPTYHP